MTKYSGVPSPHTHTQDAPPSSWVIRYKESGRVVIETYDYSKVENLDTRVYEAVPIAEYLRSLNDCNR